MCFHTTVDDTDSITVDTNGAVITHIDDTDSITADANGAVIVGVVVASVVFVVGVVSAVLFVIGLYIFVRRRKKE